MEGRARPGKNSKGLGPSFVATADAAKARLMDPGNGGVFPQTLRMK